MPGYFFKGSRWIGGALCSILLLFLCGCGNSANVSGKISYQGRPITYGSVIFLRSDNSAFTAAIKPDGSYLVEGIPPGNASIAVISRNPALGRSAVHPPKPNSAGKPEAALQETAVQGWFPLPHNYEDAKSSGLTCDITKGQVIHDIELR